MASGGTPSVLESSADITNGVKLMRLIVDGGTEALRKTFTRYQAGDLQVVLSTFQPTLSGLKGKCIKENQWDKLYPMSPSKPNINDFDITLMCILLRHTCGLLPPNSPVWKNEPTAPDHSVEADIVRIRLFRNERFGHIPSTAVSSADFKIYWAEVSSPLVRLGIDQREIDRLENEECGKEEIERVFKEWNKCESEIIASIRRMELKLEKVLSKQQFESESILNKKLVYFNFQQEIKMYYEKYTDGTREWVFEQVFTWFGDESSDNRAFVISALAGMGKSVIAAVICKRLAENVGACHFFQYNNCRYSNPNSLLQSLAWQLCDVLPAYKEALIQKLSGNLGQSLNNMNVAGLFSLLFKEPFSSIAGNGKRVLIVLDAVDESDYDGRQDLANLIANHFHKLPTYIRFLITTRPEKNLIEKFRKLNPLFIEANDERNLNDIRLVLQNRISFLGGPAVDVIDTLAKKSDGLMLYAFFLSEICKGEQSIAPFQNFPQGLAEFYERYLERLMWELRDGLEISQDTFLSFLSALAVAMEPLPQAFIGNLFGFHKSSSSTKTKVRKAIITLSSLLVVKENKSISLFHKSIRDWLVDNSEHDYMIDEQYGHKILLDRCFEELSKLKKTDVKDVTEASDALKYALKYYIAHLLKGIENKKRVEFFVSNFFADLEVMFASVCVNVDLTLSNIFSLMNHDLYKYVLDNTRSTVSDLYFLVKRFAFLFRDYPQSFLPHIVNQGEKDISEKASHLLKTRYKSIVYLEIIEKKKRDALEFRCFVSGIISGIDVSPEQDYVVCSYKGGGIELFSLITGRSEWKIEDLTVPHIDNSSMLPHCIVFHSRENWILPGRLDMVITLKGKFIKSELFQCGGNDAMFTNSCFSKNGTTLVTNYGLDLVVWNTVNGEKETRLKCSSQLLTFSFTASGRFFGTTSIDGIFKVYYVMGKYNLIRSVSFACDCNVEIASTFQENSWCCFADDCIAIVSHDRGAECACHAPWFDIVLPGNLYSSELQCFLEHPKRSWISKLMKFHPLFFLPDSFRYFAIQDKSVLVFSRFSHELRVLSINELINAEELALKVCGFVFCDISANGNFLYFKDTTSRKIIVRAVESDFANSIPYPEPSQQDILVVKNGVILYGKNLPPTLWNCDLTKCDERFHELAGAKSFVSISEELIAYVYESYIIFFDVVLKKIVFRMTFTESIMIVYACSIKFHVLAEMKSGEIYLWKDGVKVDGWADIVSKYAGHRFITAIKFSPDGTKLAFSGYQYCKCFIFDVSRMSIQFLVQIHSPNNQEFIRIKFFNDKNLLCSTTNVIYIINVENGEILTCLDFGDSNILHQLSVCRERNIVCIGCRRFEDFELIKVWWPRTTKLN